MSVIEALKERGQDRKLYWAIVLYNESNYKKGSTVDNLLQIREQQN